MFNGERRVKVKGGMVYLVRRRWNGVFSGVFNRDLDPGCDATSDWARILTTLIS